MFDTYLFVAAAPVAGLAVDCLSHILICRALPRRGPYFALMLAFFPGLIATAAVTLGAWLSMSATLADLLDIGVLNTLTYLALAWGYFHFVNLNIASLRIRILHDLAESGGNVLKSRLLAGYNTDSVIGLRIRRLVHGGHIVLRQGRYHSGKQRFLLIARIFDLMHWIIFGRKKSCEVSGDMRTPHSIEETQ